MAKPYGSSSEWNTAALSTCCVLLGAAFGATAVAFAWDQPSAIGGFIFRWQTLIGAGAAVAGIGIAWTNVSRQLRLNVLTREEDRIEKWYPGIADAAILVEKIKSHADTMGIESAVATLYDRWGFASGGSEVKGDLVRILPRTDDLTRLQIAFALEGLIAAQQHIRDATAAAEGARITKDDVYRGLLIDAANADFAKAEREEARLATLYEELGNAIIRHRILRPRIRQEIERLLFEFTRRR